MTIEPVRTRLRLPAAYGAPTDSPLLEWSIIVKRLQEAEHYWLTTADRNAVPISRPLDGIWLDGLFYFNGDPATRWRKNLSENPQVCLSLDDATNPVILDGSVSVRPLDAKDAEKVAKTTQEKYGWGSSEQFQSESCVFTPIQCLSWFGLFENATRFRFNG